VSEPEQPILIAPVVEALDESTVLLHRRVEVDALDERDASELQLRRPALSVVQPQVADIKALQLLWVSGEGGEQ